MDKFKDFFNVGIAKRHRKPILGGTDFAKKHLNVVPAKYKTPLDSNPKIETLKKRRGRFHCDHKDLEFIKRKFLKGLMPKVDELKVLGGKMNIRFYYDRNDGKWVIEKQ